MTQASFHYGLHRARGEQLRRIAARYDIPVSEVIERLIGRAIAGGVIVDELPGFSVDTRDDGQIALVIGDVEFGPVEWTSAGFISHMLASAVAGRIMSTDGISFDSLKDESKVLRVRRQGPGVVLTIEDTVTGGTLVKEVVTRQMARDLARMLKAASSKAQEK